MINLRHNIHFMLVLALLAGCTAFYGPPFDGSRFMSADTALDGKVGVFTLKRLVYRPAAGVAAFPDGGIPQYLMDRNYVALYDFATGTTRVVYREDALGSDWLPGSSTLFVAAALGPRVIIRKSGQAKGSYATCTETWWLNLEQGTRESLPLEKELASRQRRLGYFYLVDERGTLVLVVTPVGETGSPREETQELLIRHPEGNYDTVGRFVQYYGVRNGELFYWSAEHRFAAYRIATRERREPDRRESLGLSSNPKEALAGGPALAVRHDQGSYLAVGRKQGDAWHYERLPLTVRDVVGE
jgi:hypothetical protein